MGKQTLKQTICHMKKVDCETQRPTKLNNCFSCRFKEFVKVLLSVFTYLEHGFFQEAGIYSSLHLRSNMNSDP